MEQENIEQINLDHINWKSSEEFFNSLRDELDKLDDKDESYNFTWVGKRKSIIEAGAPINKTLRPDIDASKDFDNTKNMLIVGDNLDALKLLQESYLGKIKMIYIDPPYNTGHDFVYHDNFTVKKSDYEDNTTDSEGNKVISEDEFTENSKSNGRFHSDWLSMMCPRLKLARNLLTDEGVIFISIDDNEQANLKKICDEIFGEDNFLNSIIWRYTSGGIPEEGKFSSKHDTILLYAKSNPVHTLNTLLEKSYSKTIPEPETESGKKLGVKRDATCDICGNAPGAKYREVVMRDVWIDINSLFRNNYQKKMLEEMGVSFDTQKPIELIQRTILAGANQDDTILDFFAGSGTTGHAVMDLNAEDGGNRKYILVQLDEPTDEKSEARKAGYNTIDQITAERLRRAGDKIIKEHPDLEGKLDTGFRVFHIDSANEREDVRKSVYDTKQEDMFDSIDNIKHDRTPLDLLFGTIIYMALPLDLKLEVKNINNNTIYFYGYQDEDMGLIACFDDDISDETVKEIAKLKPLTAVFKDSSFKDSAAKINLSEIFRTISNETRVKVI